MEIKAKIKNYRYFADMGIYLNPRDALTLVRICEKLYHDNLSIKGELKRLKKEQ